MSKKPPPDPAVCPTCKRPFSAAPKRICGDCGKQITRMHKWRIRDGSTIVHRNCNDPRSYQ